VRATRAPCLCRFPSAVSASVTSMDLINMMWATVVVPYEAYRRGERIHVPRSRRNAALVANGYLRLDPVMVEELISPSAPPSLPAARRRRGKSEDQPDEGT